MFYPSFYSQPFDKGSKLDVTPFVDIGDGETICIELDKRWLNIFSGLVDVFRSQQYLEGTENDILEFQQKVEILQETISRMIACGGVMTCEDIEQCLSDSTIIQNIFTDIENMYSSVVNNYNTTNTIINNLDSDNPANYVNALIWEKLDTYTANDATVVNIPIRSGYTAFRIRIFGGTTGDNKANILARINGDSVNANYSSAINFEIVANSPRIGNIHANGVNQSLPAGYIECYNYDTSNSHVLSAFTYAHGDISGINRTQVGSIEHGTTAPITQIDIVGYSFPTNGDLYFEIEYLSEKQINLAKSYPPPPPPPNEPIAPYQIQTITFNPADGGVFTTQFGTVLDSLGNPDYHLYLYQASGEPVPTSLDVTIDLEQDVHLHSISVDVMHWINDQMSSNDLSVRIQPLTSADVVIDTVDLQIVDAPYNSWLPLTTSLDANNTRKVKFLFFGYTDGVNTEEYELRFDNVTAKWHT